MSTQSLANRIASAGSAYEMLYDNPSMPFAFPIALEFSNWRDEQEAWRETAILQDMSFHMYNMLIEGRDVFRLLADFGINSFASYGPMQAKQYVACNDDGHYIGDAILTCESENQVRLVGKSSVPNWIRFQLERGSYDAKIISFDKPSSSLSDQTLFRFQIQGPSAGKILEEVHGGVLPGIGFFKMGGFRVGPHNVTALNHRMSGAAGFEIWGPAAIGADVKRRLLEAGEAHGLRQIGGRVFRVTATESGWISSAVPAVYTGNSTKAFREWLPANSYEGNASIGGSYPTGVMDELYLTPFEMGYGFMVKLDHEFCGRAALEEAAKREQRKKVRLVWSSDEVTQIQASMYGNGVRSKYMEMPVAEYAAFQMDEVCIAGKRVGLSFHPAYSVASRCWISLAVVDSNAAVTGQEVSVTWGEPNGGSKKPTVERHKQTSVHAVVEAKAVRRD